MTEKVGVLTASYSFLQRYRYFATFASGIGLLRRGVGPPACPTSKPQPMTLSLRIVALLRNTFDTLFYFAAMAVKENFRN